MHRVAHLEHHVVGSVHHVVDGLLPHGSQSLCEPVRGGADLDAANDHSQESVAEFGFFDADADLGVRDLQLGGLYVEIEIRGTRDGRKYDSLHPAGSHLSGNPYVREPIAPVGRHFDIEPYVVEGECLHEGLPQRNRAGQVHDARLVPAQAELFLGAKHPVGILAAGSWPASA